MTAYRKLPIIVEAHRWFQNGDHPKDAYERGTGSEGKLVRFFRHPNIDGREIHAACGYYWHDHGWIDTLEGGHNVCPGDWIIMGVKGEFYPCKPDIFNATYELADAPA